MIKHSLTDRANIPWTERMELLILSAKYRFSQFICFDPLTPRSD